MSICLTRFTIKGLGEHNIYHDSGVFYKNKGRLWRVEVEGSQFFHEIRL